MDNKKFLLGLLVFAFVICIFGAKFLSIINTFWRPKASKCYVYRGIKIASKVETQHQMNSQPSQGLSSQEPDEHAVTYEEDYLLPTSESAASQCSNKSSKSHKVLPFVVQSLIDDMHRHMQSKILSYHGLNNDTDMDFTQTHIPQSSFRVLNKMREMVFKACAGVVPASFLEIGYLMFQTAYEISGSTLEDYLTTEKATNILESLNDCYDSMVPVKYNFGNTHCPNKTKTLEGKLQPYVFGNLSCVYHSNPNFYLKYRHLSMDIPWSMLCLTSGMCLKAPQGSDEFSLYEEMYYAMEALFTNLTILWDNPPKSEIFYASIYGSNWKQHAENLEKCVQLAYIQNPKYARPWLPMSLITQFTRTFHYEGC